MPTPPVPTHNSIAREHNVGSWIAHWAKLAPTRPAWSDDQGSKNYGEANAALERFAGWLTEAGVEVGDRVALWLGNRSETLEALLACARIGAIALPINARLTPPEVAFQIDDCRPKLLLVEPRWADAAQAALTRSSQQGKTHLCVINDAHTRAILQAPPRRDILPVSPEAPMILMYTSGTTGHPKGALLPHRKALFNSRNAEIYFDLSPSDRGLVVAPLFHSLALQILSLPTLYCGGSLRLQDGFDPERAWKTIDAEGITFFGGVPTMHERLLASLDAGDPFTRAPASVRFAFSAGAAAPLPLIEAFHRHGLAIQQGYGQTETSVLTCQRPGEARLDPGGVGRPVEHAEIRLIDSGTADGPVAQWRDVSPGEVGEVVVRGPITMLGYWERPEATDETLRENWVRTGDLATRDASFSLTLVGRAREMYISGGENVYPAEVEAVLVQHPAIAEAAVLARPDAEWGEIGVAHIVPATGHAIDEAEVQAFLAERLAGFKRPRALQIESELPRTASGKVQKNRLGQKTVRGD